MSQQQHFESQLDQQHKQQHTLNNQQQLSYQQQHGIQKQQPKLQYQQSQHKIPPQQQNKPQHQQQHYQHETKQHIQTLTETLAQMQQRKQQQQHNNLDVELMLESLFVFSPQLADIQANETCDWLVKTGFPQYAKLYRDGNTQIDTCGVKADHPFLDDISLKSLLRRIEILNTIASLKLNNRLSALSSVPPTSLFDTPPNSSQENILDNDFSEDTCNKSSMGRCSEGMKGRESNIQQNEQKLQTFQEKQLRQSLNVIQQQHHKHQQQQQKHRTASSSSSDSSAQEDELIINNKYNDKNSIITSYNDKNSIIESHKNEIVPKNDETKKNINKSINSTTTTNNNNNNNNNSDVSDTTPLTPSQRRQKQHDDVIKSIQEIDLDALLPSFKQPIKAENRPESVEAETVKSKLEENKYGDSSDDSYMENLSLIRDFYQNIPQLADEGDGDDKNNNNNNNNNEIECSGDDDEHDGYDDDDTDDPFERLMQLSQSLMSHTSTQRHNDSIFGTTKHPIKVRYSRSFTHAKRNIHAHTTQTYVSDDNIFNLRLNRHRNETLLHQRTKNQNGKCNFNETAEKSFNQLSTQVTPTFAKPPFKNLFRRASKAFNKSFKRKQSRDNKVAKNEENKSGDALGNNKKSEESSKDNNGDENQTNYTTTYNNNNNNKNNINSMHYKEPNHEEQQARFNSPTTQTPVRDVRGDFEAILNLLYVNIFKLSKDEEEEEDDDDGDSRSNSSVLTPSSTDATFNFSPKLCITPNHFVAGDEDDDEEDGLRKGYDDDVLSRMFGPCFKKMYKDDININNNNNNNNNNNQKENNNNGKKNVNNKNNIKITNKLVDNDDGGRYDVMSTNNRTLIKINGQDHSGNYDNDVFNKHNNNLNNMENNDNTLRNNRVKDDNNITTTTTTTNNNRNNNDDEVVHVDGREMSVDSGVGWSRGGDDEDVDVTKSKMAPLARINSCEYELEERRGGGTDNDFDHKNANKNNKDEESNRSGDNDMETFRSVDDDDEEDEDNNARDDDNDDDDDEEEDDDDDGWVYPDIPLRERSDSGIGSSLSRRPSNNRTVRWKSFLNSRYNKNSNYCNTQQRNNNQTNNVNNDIEKKSLNDVTKNDVNNNSNNNNIINNNNNNKNNIISTSINNNNNNNNNIINTLTDLNKSIQYDTRYLTTTQTTKLKRFCTHRLIAVFEALNCSDRKLCRSLTDKKPKPLHLTPPKHHLTLRLRNGDDPLEGDLFGVPLEVVRIRTGQSVPRCVMLAMKQLKRSTGDMEGVFRKPGSKLRLQQLHRDCVLRPDKIDYDRTSAYDLAGLIRHFLRSIPGKLFDSVTTKLLVHIFKNVKSEHHQREMVQCCMVLMSEDHRDVAHVFTLFLHHLALKCASTKMTASNLSLCLTPSLFHVKMPSLSSPSSSLSSSSSKRQTSQYNKCLSIQKHLHTALTFLINHAPSIFTDLKGLMVQCQLRASGYTHTNTDIRTDNHHYLYIHPSIHHSLLTTLCNNIVTPLFLKLQESTTSSKGWSNVITIDPRSLSCSSSSSSSSSSLSYGPIEVSHKRASSKDSLHTHKTSIIIKAPPIEILIAVLRYRGSWNDDVLKWRQLQTMGDNMEVYEFVLNCMAPQQPRIFTLLRAWRTDLPKGGCMLVSQSVEHHATLPTIKSPRHKPVSERASSTAHQSLDSPNPHPFQSTCVQPSFSPLLLSPKQRSILRLVRGEMVAEHWVIVPSSSSSTRVTMISSVDFKGYSPEWYERVYTYVNAHHMHKLACFFHERLHRHMNLMGPETCV